MEIPVLIKRQIPLFPMIVGVIDRDGGKIIASAIDSTTGDFIHQVTCSDIDDAKSELCFTQLHHIEGANAKYNRLFPNGYNLLWVGDWKNLANLNEVKEIGSFLTTVIIKMLETRHRYEMGKIRGGLSVIQKMYITERDGLLKTMIEELDTKNRDSHWL